MRRAGAALLVALGAGCSSARSTSPPPTSSTLAPSTTTTTTIPGQDPSPGCALAGARPPVGDVAHVVTIAGVVHPYLLSIPASYEAGHPLPLVVEFHGFGSDYKSFATLTNMPALGAARGVIVLTPDGPNNTWQLNGSGSDATYIDTVVASIENALCVDVHRVYAAGFSQGAAFALIYSCARQDRIAAISTVAVDFQLGCKQPVPILAFHGTADPLVPYQNGAIGLSLPGDKVRGTMLNLGDWARLDECSPTPTTKIIGTQVTLSIWPRCTAGTEVELYTVEKGGHSWPGANPASNPTFTTQQISATALMLDFFHGHHLGAAG
jgi:polyhydroxybutyrate depolymerase